ncbi:MAG: class I SAM-dependent methyltransferase [Acidimicrobiales bacterium]
MAYAPDWSERVRRGYDVASCAYRADDAESGLYAAWIHRLDGVLPRCSRVVDLGCGCGVPVARDLAAAGHAVVGVDLSQTQIERARRLVPAGEFHCDDLAGVDFAEGSFDAAVFLYSIIHLPLDQQPVILQRVARWLRPGGVLALIAGVDAWTGSEDRWLGSDATMWWSQADSSTYRGWLEAAGFFIDEEVVVSEGLSAHALFWAHSVRGRSGGPDE